LANGSGVLRSTPRETYRKEIHAARGDRSPLADNDVAIPEIGDILQADGEAERARSGMIRFSL
jgi:hypothetical protein